MKRFFDIFFSSLAILVLSPLLIPIIIILKLTGEHYIFYAQERMGKSEKPFNVLKFATMLKNSPNMAGANVTKRDDPGPLTVDQYNNYSEKQRSDISRLTPGLTGIGSLIFRDEESIMERSGMDYNEIHDTIIAEYKGNLESWFYNNNSIGNYFRIILFTAWSVIKSDINFRQYFKDLPEPKGILEKLL